MAQEAKEQLIKSRKRVRDHGEVFTPGWLVRDMCDLVANECLRPESRFLEPACGDGNFLAEILSRKLSKLKTLFRRGRDSYERDSFLAVASLYGVDLLADNVARCRVRLFEIWEAAYPAKKSRHYPDLSIAIQAVLTRNILCGDALTLLQADGSPLAFTEWSLAETTLSLREYTLNELLTASERNPFKPLPKDNLFANAAPPAPAMSRIPRFLSARSLTPYWELARHV